MFNIIWAHISSRSSLVIHFTVAFVQTGIKIGVLKVPWAVVNSQALAYQSVFSSVYLNIKYLYCKIDLKYYNGNPVIRKIKRISKPGIRVYSKISDLPKSYGGLGISILSTPKGVMSDQKARDHNVGGEVLCEVF